MEQFWWAFIRCLRDTTGLLIYSLDKAYNKKLHQQEYLEHKQHRYYKNDFKVYEFFEKDYGENEFEIDIKSEF